MVAMAFFPRASRAPVLLSLVVALAFPATAQQRKPQAAPAAVVAPVAIDHTAWLYKGSDLAPDPAWQFGTLPNGLRYAVRRNGVPPGQVAVRVRIDAGSLAETDAERGFAHLIEHLSFRGSEYVPDGEAKRTWQRFGATFGSDSNAQTTPVATLYKLDLPSATTATVDESLKILSGMMAQPAITDTALHAELPVVLAERREQPGPQVRLSDAMNAAFFAGQPLADRSPIGSIQTLQAATAATVRAFHDRWYRPERAVVIISGDMDPAVAAQLVAKNFAGWTGVGPSPADPDFGTPDAKRPTTGSLVEPGLPPLVAVATVRPWHFNNDTALFNQKRYVDTLATRLISRRLEQRARAGGSFLQASVALDDVQRSANVTSVTVVPIGDDWQAALRDVRAVIADALATAPTQAEVDREYADFDTILRTGVEQARVEAGAKQADDLASALDIRETVTSPASSYAVLKDAHDKGMFTPAALLASTRRLFQGDATRALVNIHQPDPAAATKLAAALAQDVSGLAVKRRAQAAVDISRLPALGVPGSVASNEALPVLTLDMRKVVFANGVRLLLYPDASQVGRVFVRVNFGGGYNALPAKRPSAAWAGESALMASGIGTLDQNDLEALSAGRNFGLDFDIGDDAFSIAALTSPADYRDELRLMAAKIAHPGWDPAPVQRAKATALAAYPSLGSSPDGVLSRDLEGLLHDGDPRWGTPTRETIAALNPRDFRKLWEPLLATGPIEVSVFGDVKGDEAVAAVGASFGALKPRRASTATPPPVRFPAHTTAPVIRTHTGPDTQAAAVIAWPTGSGIDGVKDARQLDVLAQIFSDRLFDRLRNAAGASYSPNVASQWPVGAPGGGRLIAIGQVSPDKVPFFFQLSREIAADLVANPVGPDELKRLLVPMAQSFIRASTSNLFWMRQLGGATYDPRRVAATVAIPQDLLGVTPASLQAVAAKYLKPERDWTMAVVPSAKAAATGAPAAGAATPAR
jgi:zinc protease